MTTQTPPTVETLLARMRESIRGEVDGTTIPVPVEDIRALLAAQTEWEYGIAPLEGNELDGIPMESREAAERQVEKFYDRKMLRRRRAGAWEVLS